VTAIICSPQSLRDLEGIQAHIAQDSPRYAELVVQRVVAGVERLETFPESGRVVPELDRPEIREIIVRPYRVVYRYRGDVVDTVTVFRSSRQIPEIP
jgi:toxin ParE1/3/4